MRHSAVRSTCIFALLVFPVWSAAGCGGASQEGEGGDGGAAGTAGSGGAGGTAGTGGVGGTAGTGGVDLCAGVDCDDHNECTIDGTCNPQTGECEGGLNAGGTCDYMGGAGVCDDGVCVDADLCEPYPCEGRGECVADQCNPADGQCSYPYVPTNYLCNEDGGSVCDGAGHCVECTHSNHCSDGDPCTSDICYGKVWRCGHTQLPDGQVCGEAAICFQGDCENDPLGQRYFSGDQGDLTSGLYQVYEGFYRYGLAGFYFDFIPDGVDHELERLMPGFLALDYNPSLPGDETAIYARYEDNNADDAYNWRIDGQQLPWGTTRSAATGCRQSTGTFTIQTGVSDAWLPMLLGFDLDRSTDHNVGDILVRVGKTGTNVWLSVTFADKNDDDSYCYRVHYALVPAARVRTTGHEEGVSYISETVSIDARAPILQGFRIGYGAGGNDTHIDELGVRLLPGSLRVWFHDDDPSLLFLWEVWWADLL